jgi:hypothetical protein
MFERKPTHIGEQAFPYTLALGFFGAQNAAFETTLTTFECKRPASPSRIRRNSALYKERRSGFGRRPGVLHLPSPRARSVVVRSVVGERAEKSLLRPAPSIRRASLPQHLYDRRIGQIKRVPATYRVARNLGSAPLFRGQPIADIAGSLCREKSQIRSSGSGTILRVGRTA